MAYLVLMRHGQSERNAKGVWTGRFDSPLTEKGKQEARDAAKHLKGITFQRAYTSDLIRSKRTLEEVLAEMNHKMPITKSHKALSERDYGDYTGLNKWEAKEKLGDKEFNGIRRGWDHHIPNGETLKDVHARVVPYYTQNILEDLKNNHNVIVSAHGNSLRALVKHLEAIPSEEVHALEIGTGEIYMYEVNSKGSIINKTILNSGNKA